MRATPAPSKRRLGSVTLLAMAVGGFAIVGTRAAAADTVDFTVTSTADSLDAGTLRHAIGLANASGAPDVTVLLPPGVYALTRCGGDDTNVEGDLDITGVGRLTLAGTAGGVLIRQSCADRAVDAHSADLVIRNLTIEGSTVGAGGVRSTRDATLVSATAPAVTGARVVLDNGTTREVTAVTAQLDHATVVGAVHATTLDIRASAIVGAAAAACDGVTEPRSRGDNWVSDASCHLSGVSDVELPRDVTLQSMNFPVVAPLAAYGAQLRTFAPYRTSPLTDAIPSWRCHRSVDARGALRPSGAGCDIGAVELRAIDRVNPPSIADVEVTVEPSPVGGVAPGASIRQDLVVTNRGPYARPVELLATVDPYGTTTASDDGACTTYVGDPGTTYGYVSCVWAGAVPVGGIRRVELTGTAPVTAREVWVSAEAFAADGDPLDANNIIERHAVVTTARADVGLTNSTDGTFTAGAIELLSWRAANAGPSPASGLRVTATLPPGLAFRGHIGGTWTCRAWPLPSADGIHTRVTCEHPAALAVGAADTVLVKVVAAHNTPSSLVVSPTITADPRDETQEDNQGHDSIVIEQPPPPPTTTTTTTTTTTASTTSSTGSSSSTTSSTTTTRRPQAPGPPRNVTAAAGVRSLTVSWTPPASDGGAEVLGYLVIGAPRGSASAPADARQVVIDDLEPGVAHTFTVLAFNEIGESIASWPSIPVAPFASSDCQVDGVGPFTDVSWDSPFCSEIEAMSEAGIVTGYADGSFRPAGVITRQALAAFLHRAAGSPSIALPATPRFADVPREHPFATPIEWAAREGLVAGYPDGRFRPGAGVTRQATAAILYRWAGVIPDGHEVGYVFRDVAPDHPFGAEIEWLVATGAASGYSDGRFHPESPTTRQAIAAILFDLRRATTS